MTRKLQTFIIILTLLTAGVFFGMHRPSMAACNECAAQYTCSSKCAEISNNETENTKAYQKNLTIITIQHLKQEFVNHRKWMVEVLFARRILPALMLFTEQISAMAMNQVLTIGMFLDAKHQLETQQLFQELTAQAHKDYQVSEGVCTFGTNVRSLAASDRNTDLSAIAISSRARQRELLSGNTLTGNGATSDFLSRVAQYREVYCDKKDNGKGLDLLCPNGSVDPGRVNNDVNYTAMVDSPLTLKFDITQEGNTDHANNGHVTTVSADEEDILALQSNLYAHNLPPKIPVAILSEENGVVHPGAVNKYMDIRALAAKRSVATNSFAAIAGMKAQGEVEAKPYLYAIMKEMGISDENEISKYLGDRPSYYAQMEILTKKLYQNPMFYTDLYDKPQNVERKLVSMQAIELMQRRDMYRSVLRSEATLSVMLETVLEEKQSRIGNEINRLRADGELIKLQ